MSEAGPPTDHDRLADAGAPPTLAGPLLPTRRATLATMAAAMLPGAGNQQSTGSTSASSGPDAGMLTFRQAGAPIAQPLQAKLARIVDLDDFRLPTDTDDTAAFRRALAALVETGGEIRLDPRRRYRVSESIVISSLRHIAISSDGGGQVYDGDGGGIAVTAAMPSLFRVAAPATRGTHGGVSFRGLSFFDASGSGGTPGQHAIGRALLDLQDAALSTIADCRFHFINGCVIRTEFFVQSTITGCYVRYCGSRGSGTIHIGGSDPRFASQAVTIHDVRMEVCYGDAYLLTEGSSQAITITACTFEAATEEYPPSSKPFLDLSGNEYKVVSCSLNRNRAQAMILRGRGVVTACSFETGPSLQESLFVPGSRNVVAANAFTDNRRGCSVRARGVLNAFTGNRFYASGGIVLEGANNQFRDNVIDSPTMTEGGYCLLLADYCAASGNHFNGYDFAGTRYTPLVGGVILYGRDAIFAGNSCRGWSGRTFIRVEHATAVFRPNVHDGVGSFVTTGVALHTRAAAAALMLPTGTAVVTITGNATITTIAAGAQWAGISVTLLFTGRTTVAVSGDIRLARPFTSRAGDTLTIVGDGSAWYEASRTGS